ncbi:MAG: hypothetical protein ABSA45_07095 [Verrucomicrobiota bacterium]
MNKKSQNLDKPVSATMNATPLSPAATTGVKNDENLYPMRGLARKVKAPLEKARDLGARSRKR